MSGALSPSQYPRWLFSVIWDLDIYGSGLAVRYSVEVVGSGPDEQVERTIFLMGKYVLEDLGDPLVESGDAESVRSTGDPLVKVFSSSKRVTWGGGYASYLSAAHFLENLN